MGVALAAATWGNGGDPPFQTFNFAAIREPGGSWQKLNELIPPNSGWDLRSAAAINSRGQIVGVGFDSQLNKQRAYLLTPAPVPVPAPPFHFSVERISHWETTSGRDTRIEDNAAPTRQSPLDDRIVNGTIDIGAFEVQASPIPPTRPQSDLFALILATADVDSLEKDDL